MLLYDVSFNGKKKAEGLTFEQMCKTVEELLCTTQYGEKFAITVEIQENGVAFTIASWSGDFLFVDNDHGLTATFYEDDQWYFWSEHRNLITSGVRFEACLKNILTRGYLNFT